MIKRTLKRTLSIMLTLVLLATTFFIFDPSVLKLNADAWLSVTPLEKTSRPVVTFRVPETIYTDMFNSFKYYVDSDDTGALNTSRNKTSGLIQFESNVACQSIRISISNSGDVDEIVYSNNTGSGKNLVASDVSVLYSNIIDGSADSGTAIKWDCEYTTTSGTFHSYATTYVYQVSTEVIGSGYSGTAHGTFGDGDWCVFNFSTGYHSVEHNQSYKFRSAFTTNVPIREGSSIYFYQFHPMTIAIGSNDWGKGDGEPYGSDGGGIGHQSGSIYAASVDMDDNQPSLAPLLDGPTANSGSIMYGGHYSGGSGTITQPTTTLPTANITIDKSRYTNTNQIPYLQAIDYWPHIDYFDNLYTNFYYSINGGAETKYLETEHIDKDDGKCRIRYVSTPIISPVQSSNYTLNLHAYANYEFNGAGSHDRQINLYQKVNVTVVDKSTLRSKYREGSNTAFKSDEISANQTYINNLWTMGSNLGNPASTTTTTYNVPTLADLGSEPGLNAPKIKFYVPETIYLTPARSATTFQYYVDCDSSGNLSKTRNKTSGNIYFKCEDSSATVKSLTCSATAAIGNTSSTNNELSTTVTGGSVGALTQGTSTTITWTVTYTINGVDRTAKSYSVVYAPFLSPIAAGVKSAVTSECYANSFGYISGIHSVSSTTGCNVYPSTNNLTPLLGSGNLLAISAGAQKNPKEMNFLVDSDTYNAKSATYDEGTKSNGMGHQYESTIAHSGTGSLIVDISRYNNLSQITNLTYGFGVTSTQYRRDDGGWFRWYVADFTGIDVGGTGHTSSSDNCYNEYDRNNNGIIAGDKSTNDRTEGHKVKNAAISGLSNLDTSSTGTTNILLGCNSRHKRDPSSIAYTECDVCGAVYLHLDVVRVNKSDLRSKYLSELEVGRQQDWFTSESWSAYETAMKNAADALGNFTAKQSDVTSKKTSIDDAINALKIEKTNWSATADHKSNASGNKLLGTETIGYSVGDNIYVGPNEYTGYTYASVTPPTGATNANPSVAKNVKTDNLTWTLWYTPKTYNVIYKPNEAEGGLTSNTNVTATYDSYFEIGKINGTKVIPTRTGYDFDGWAFSGDGKVYKDGDHNENPFIWNYDADNLEVMATWVGHKYNIEFSKGDDSTISGSMTTMTDLSYGNDYVLSQNGFTKPGHTFAGWSTTKGATAATYADKATVSNLTPVDGATVTLYPVWTKQSYYLDLNGWYTGVSTTTEGNISGYGKASVYINGSSNPHANGNNVADFYQQFEYGTTYEIKNITPEKGKYYVGIHGNGAGLTGTMDGAKSVVLEFDTEKYNINFYRNYDSSDNTKTTLQNVVYGSTRTDIPVPARTGYTFNGWFLARSGGTATYGTGSSLTINYDPGEHVNNTAANNNNTINLYAQWTPHQITVTYKPGTGSGTDQTQTFSYGSSVTTKAGSIFTPPAAKQVKFDAAGGSISSSTDGTADGLPYLAAQYSFSGWKSNKGGGNIYTESTTYSGETFDYFGVGNDTAVTLTAQWTVGQITLPTVADRPGYKFDGWYDGAGSSAKFVGEAGATKVSVGSYTTLYGHWSKGTYTLDVYAYGNILANEGAYSSSNPGGTVKIDSGTASAHATKDDIIFENSVSVTATPAEGYRFDGWYKANNFTDANKLSTNTTYTFNMPGANTAYYAKFSVIYYTVSAGLVTGTPNGATVKVTGNTDGTEDTTSSAKVLSGGQATLSATAPAGYHFTGWNTKADGTGTAVTSPVTNVTANATYYAKFDINRNTLTVDPAGGSVTIGGTAYTESKSFTQNGGTPLTVSTPTKAGYHFTGWTNNPATLNGSLAGTTYTFPSNVNGQIDTITANWDANTYTIVFNKNDSTATGTMSDLSMTYGTAKNLTANAFTKAGYSFAGWATTSTGAVVYADEASVNNLTTDNNGTVNLYAKWNVKSYDVKIYAYSNTADSDTYSNNTTGGTVKFSTDASGAALATKSVAYGSSATIVATPAAGYTFEGWCTTAPTASTAVSDSAASKSVEITEENGATWYAKFSINSYTVAVKAYSNTAANKNSFTESTVGGTVSVSPTEVKHGKTVTLTATAEDGYTFEGWYENASLTGTALSSNTPTITANKTYYAKFAVKETTVKVYAYSNGSGSYTQNTVGGTVTVEGVTPVIAAAQSITMGYNGSYKVTATAAEGYTFDGWYTNSGLTAAATGATATTATTATFTKKDADETLYAKFTITTPELTVYAYSNAAGSTNYNNNMTGGTVKINSGDTGAQKTANVNYNTTATITAAPATGYTFDGWYSTVTGGNGNTVSGWGTRFSTDLTATTASIKAATAYYAKFTIKSVIVTYELKGGSYNGSTTATAYYNTDMAIVPVPTRLGYTLIGWSEDPAATAATYTDKVGASAVNGWISNNATEKTLYAVWQAIEYSAIVTAAYDTHSAPGTYNVGITGGTATLRSGVTKLKTGDNVESMLNISPATGYELKEIKYSVSSTAPTGNVTSWGSFTTANTDEKTIPALEAGSTVAFVACFGVKKYTVTAIAYYNTTADTTTYAQGAVGGTVKCGDDGVLGGSGSEDVYFGGSITLYAQPNTGYQFDGWCSTVPTASTEGTTGNKTVTITTDAGATWYAKFSVKVSSAYARAVYYTDGANDATGYGEKGIIGGTVKVSTDSNTTGATTTGADAVSVRATYTEFVTYEATPATGYEFAGWFESPDADDNVDISENEAIESDLTYYAVMPDTDIRYHAKFVPCNFILTLDPNGGTVGRRAQVTLTYGQSAVLDADTIPVYISHNFVGWAEGTETTATYTYTNDICEIAADIVKDWYDWCVDNSSVEYTIHAIWENATYTVILDHQNGEENTEITVILTSAMPEITKPEYDGYNFKGYFTEPGCGGTAYYDENADGTTWDLAYGTTLYAGWTCPVLKDATYDEETGEWTYTYEKDGGGTTDATSDTALLDKQDITDNAPGDAKEITSLDKSEQTFVKDRVKKTEKINLNHYTEETLDALLTNVNKTNTDVLRGKLSQVELNEYVAKLARYTDIEATGNKKTTETVKPTIKLYETKDKVQLIKNDTLTKDLSVTGENYAKPSGEESGTYTYNDKYSYYKEEAVDYYIYTNSPAPVIALEIDDGEVGTKASNNTSSYPTKATVTPECNTSIVTNKATSYIESAVPATDDLNSAWFSKYTKANIGIENDYNAKEVIYLTPTFKASSATSTTDEIVYTINPSDDATTPNDGLTSTEIANIPVSQSTSFTTYTTKQQPEDSITVCVCYHNAMNGTSDKGGEVEDPYLQMYIDQTDKEAAYADTYLQQMHLYRQAGGANNWEIVLADESVYPVIDPTYKDTGYVLGSFAYVFDVTNEETATGYMDEGNYDAAEAAIIRSIKNKASVAQSAILDKEHSEHITYKGTGFFSLGGWSTNFYPAENTYVYAHLIDRWGNEFNRIWKCFKIDDYTPVITGNTRAYTITENGGGKLASITIDGGSDINFATGLDSSFEDGVFVTSGNQFTIITGKPKSKLAMTVTDGAGNKISGTIPTDANGNLFFTVNDLGADLTDEAYTFSVNGVEVNLYAREPALVRSAEMQSAVFEGRDALVTVKTSAEAIKVQLVDEKGVTRTYQADHERVSIVENEDGTLTWTIAVPNLVLGSHSFKVNGRNAAGWVDSGFVVSTKVINVPVEEVAAFIYSVSFPAEAEVGEDVAINVVTNKLTTKLQLAVGNSAKTFTSADTQVVENEDGTLTWTINRVYAKRGEEEIILKARSAREWNDAESFGTITVKEREEDRAVICSVEASEAKIGVPTELKVVTTKATIKVQFIFSNTTATYTADNADVVDNGDGTLTWTITRKFTKRGEEELILKARSADSWSEEQSFGTVTVK